MFGINNTNIAISDILMNTTIVEARNATPGKKFIVSDISKSNSVTDASTDQGSGGSSKDEEEPLTTAEAEKIEDLHCLTNNTKESRTSWCKSQSQNVSDKEVNACKLDFCSICCSASKYIMKCNDECNSKLVKVPLKNYDIFTECFNKDNSNDKNQIKLEGCKTCCDSKNDLYLHTNDYQ